MTKIRLPNARIRLKTGAGLDDGAKVVQSWDHAKIQIKQRGDWILHPDFRSAEFHEFTIELAFNSIYANLHCHNTCHSGPTAFCFSAHHWGDELGVAQRLGKDGRRFLTECNPTKCPMRLQSINTTGYEKEIAEEFAKVYPQGKLAYTSGKGEKRVISCKPYTILMFLLVDPRDDSKYLHGEGELAYFASHSEVIRTRFVDALRQANVMTQGDMAGLRLKLVYDPFTNKASKGLINCWSLYPPDTDMVRQKVEAATRRQTRTLDYENPDVQALALHALEENNAMNLSQYVAAQNPEALRDAAREMSVVSDIRSAAILPSEVDLVIWNPFVERMRKRMRLSYARFTQLPETFEDVRHCMNHMKAYADGNKIDVDDIWSEYQATLGIVPRPALPDPPAAVETAPAQVDTVPAGEIASAVRGQTAEPVDAEFSEVLDLDNLTEEEFLAKRERDEL